MKDYYGKEIGVGDFFIYSSSGHVVAPKIGVVTKITPKRVKGLEWQNVGYIGEHVFIPKDIIKVELSSFLVQNAIEELVSGNNKFSQYHMSTDKYKTNFNRIIEYAQG